MALFKVSGWNKITAQLTTCYVEASSISRARFYAFDAGLLDPSIEPCDAAPAGESVLQVEEFYSGRYQPPARTSEPKAQPRAIECTRCRIAMRYMGTKQFHEGRRWGVLGDWGEMFVNKEGFDVYACPRCGLVEMFVDGIGEELRPH